MAEEETGDRAPKEVNRILYAHIISSRDAGRPTVDMIAEDMGWTVVRLYKVLEGELSIKVEDFPRLYRACGRPLAALEYMVRRCEPRLYLHPRETGELNGRIDDELAALHITEGKFYELLTRAKADGLLDPEEKSALRTVIGALRPVIDQIDAELEYGGRR